jgi:hypothetical protein
MTLQIRITKTQTITYDVADQDEAEYQEHDVVNIHMAALYDLKSLEEEDFTFEDIQGDEDDPYYEVELVEYVDGVVEGVMPVDPNNKERDTELFPEEKESDDEDEDLGVTAEELGPNEAFLDAKASQARGESYGHLL